MSYIKHPSKAQKEEWQAKAAAQENEVRQMIKGIAENYKSNPEAMAELFEFGSKFYDYSYKNNMLILSQNRGATYVQSFDAWKKMGHPVKSGEHGLKIFVPVSVTYLKIPNEMSVPLSKATREQKEDYKAGKIEGITRLHFKIGNVFDISQTNYPKEDYPQIFCVGYPSELHSDIYKGLKGFSGEVLDCPVFEKNLNSIALRGTYHPIENRIMINELMEDTQQLSTLTHELGHALVHRGDSKKSIAQKEFEADAVSIMLQSNYGIPLTESRKKHLADHYNIFKQELSKAENSEKLETALNEKLEEVYTSVFSIYRENIEQINAHVERYIPHERLLQPQLSEKEKNVRNPEEGIANPDSGCSQLDNLNLANNKLSKKLQEGSIQNLQEHSFVERACKRMSDKIIGKNFEPPEMEFER